MRMPLGGLLNMKYIANITTVLHKDIHKIGTIINKEIVPIKDMPLAERIELEENKNNYSCMIIRFTKDGQFCGDTWHENIDDAFAQAKYEYGLERSDFVVKEK
jgi:hypothetical protein